MAPSARRGDDPRRQVAGGILVVVLIGGYFAASRGPVDALPRGYVLTALALAAAFWFPAVRVEGFNDLLRQWRPLLLWLLAWALAWDLATAGLFMREPLHDWWLVYPAGVLVPGALLLLHATVVARWAETSES